MDERQDEKLYKQQGRDGCDWITKSKYEKKRKEYRTEQRKINNKIAKLHFADEEYYLTSEYLLKLASRASELFESSELHEKRLLLKMTLQSLELDGKNVRFNWIKPFDTIANYASRQLWLARWDDFRTEKLIDVVEYPEIELEQSSQLLSL